MCFYVDKKWCNMVFVREALCAPDNELLSISLRPFYLPREFPQLFDTLVYIHPGANASRAIEHITDNIHKLDSISPDAPKFILWDFNHCSLNKTLKTYHQYVTCPTPFNKTIDLCFGTVPGVYMSLALPPLGSADHNSVQAKLQALVYDILPSTTVVFSYAIGSRKLSANEQFFVGA